MASRIYLPEPAAASFRLSALADALATRVAAVTVLTATAPRSLSVDAAAGGGVTAGGGGAAAQVRDRAPGSSGAPDRVAASAGVAVRRFPVLRDRDGYVRGYLQYLSFDVPLAIRLLFARRPDVVLCEPPPTTGAVVLVVCALRRIPYVYYAADIWSDASQAAGAPGAVIRLLAKVEGTVVRRAAGVLTVSEDMVRRLATWRRDGVHNVGHGVDVTLFSPDGPIPEHPTPYFLYAGTASEVHGALVFVEAFRQVLAEHPQARLVFAGQGTDFDRVREIAAELPAGSVAVLPRMSAGETAGWMRAATATLASIDPDADYDYAVPTKALASLACGTRVLLAGPSPLAQRIAADELGWAVPHEPAAVAAAMLDALAEPGDPAVTDRLARWATQNASSARVAADAADFILQASGTSAAMEVEAVVGQAAPG